MSISSSFYVSIRKVHARTQNWDKATNFGGGHRWEHINESTCTSSQS